MSPTRRNFSVLDLLTYTGFIAVGLAIANRFTRGMFFPAITFATALYRITNADANANRYNWAKFAVGTGAYMLFIPYLDIFFEHLIWRVFEPQGRFGTLIYFFIQMATLFFPIVFHAVVGWLCGALAANATSLLLGSSLASAIVWIWYPLSNYRNKWVDPLFDSSIVPWQSFDFYCAALSLSAVALCLLQIASSLTNYTQRSLYINASNCAIAILFVVVLVGAR